MTSTSGAGPAGRLVSRDAELARLVPSLGGEDVAPGPAGALGKARLFELLLGVIGHLGVRRPVLLVIEDLHWADGSWMFPAMRRPEARVHFAGEHASLWIAWMNGALESGERTVREILAADANAT